MTDDVADAVARRFHEVYEKAAIEALGGRFSPLLATVRVLLDEGTIVSEAALDAKDRRIEQMLRNDEMLRDEVQALRSQLDAAQEQVVALTNECDDHRVAFAEQVAREAALREGINAALHTLRAVYILRDGDEALQDVEGHLRAALAALP